MLDRNCLQSLCDKTPGAQNQCLLATLLCSVLPAVPRWGVIISQMNGDTGGNALPPHVGEHRLLAPSLRTSSREHRGEWSGLTNLGVPWVKQGVSQR